MTCGQAGFKREGSSKVRHSCRDLFHHRRRGWAGGRRQKNCLSMELQTKVEKVEKNTTNLQERMHNNPYQCTRNEGKACMQLI